MKPLTVDEYEKLPYNHIEHNLTPLLMGCDLNNWFCDDCKIIVRVEHGSLRYIPNDKENFGLGYVKRPKINRADIRKGKSS